jgi:hypothetical protein
MPRRRLDVKKAKADICTALKAHNTLTTAARYAGIANATLWRWMDTDREFKEAVEKAEADSDVRLVSIILREASTGTWQAAAWLLERHPRTKREWKRLEELDVRKLSTDQLLALAAEIEGRVESTGDRAALAEGQHRE